MLLLGPQKAFSMVRRRVPPVKPLGGGGYKRFPCGIQFSSVLTTAIPTGVHVSLGTGL